MELFSSSSAAAPLAGSFAGKFVLVFNHLILHVCVAIEGWLSLYAVAFSLNKLGSHRSDADRSVGDFLVNQGRTF